MPWKSIDVFSASLKGKYVRFVRPHHGSNLSSQFKINTAQKDHIKILPGAIGRIYEVRGMTLYIGLSKDLRTAPPATSTPTAFGATIQLYGDEVEKVEVDG